MAFRDLPAQDKPDTGTAWFRSEKGNEQIRRVRNARTFVENPHLELRTQPRPTYFHFASGFLTGVGGIANQIDEQLVELIGVG